MNKFNYKMNNFNAKMCQMPSSFLLTKLFLTLCLAVFSIFVDAQQWIGPVELTIPVPQEAKPYTRWW